MLHPSLEPLKTYEELLGEAIGQIPMYSPQWTNFNPSDPGITILENLTAFQSIQQDSIRQVTEKTRENLLKLVGYTPSPYHASRVPLEMPAGCDGITLPTHKKLVVGDMMFETGKPVRLRDASLQGVYQITSQGLQWVTPLLNPNLPIGVEPFGKTMEEGSGLALDFTQLPPPGKALTLFVQTLDPWERNPWDGEIPDFATVAWQVWTAQGWETVTVLDRTGFFLKSGKITVVMPETPTSLGAEGLKGYGVRCVLQESHFDMPPSIHAIFDNVFEVRQRNTLAASFAKGGSRVTVRSTMVDDALFQVFVRETGEPNYRQYFQGTESRWYRIRQQKPGQLVLELDKTHLDDGPDAVRVVCYTEQSVNWRHLGQVFGYDDQKIDMVNLEKVIPEGFQVLAEMDRGDGEKTYQFYGPNLEGEDQLGYTLNTRDGTLELYNPLICGICNLYLCDCAVTRGAEGNLRRGNTLTTVSKPEWRETPLSFVSLGYGEEGTSYETLSQMGERFAKELEHLAVAVTASDYERVALETPGLCLESAKATVYPEENRVQVAVKPKSQSRFPTLSPLYVEAIARQLEAHRMITTKIQVVQPKYVAIYLQIRLQIGQASKERQSALEAQIRSLAESLFAHCKLGERLSLATLYRQVEALADVNYLYEILPRPSDPARAVAQGAYLEVARDTIAYLGDVSIQFVW